MRGAVGGTHIFLNQEAQLSVGGVVKHFDMGKCFVIHLPLVPLPTISIKNAHVENHLVGVVHNLLGQVGCGTGVVICESVIDMTPDELNGVSGSFTSQKLLSFASQSVLYIMG